VCVCVCARACVRACVRVCVCACVRLCARKNGSERVREGECVCVCESEIEDCVYVGMCERESVW